ncbi:MAG: hypothetical protein AAB387_07160, partial [candidate division NC10 bacterium]
MRGEIDTYSRELRWILDQIGVSLRGLTPAQLNWRPPTGAARHPAITARSSPAKSAMTASAPNP